MLGVKVFANLNIWKSSKVSKEVFYIHRKQKMQRVRITFIILTPFTHFELPLCYFLFLFNLKQGHPLSSPSELQKARDNTEARLCLQEVRKKLTPEKTHRH